MPANAEKTALVNVRVRMTEEGMDLNY